MTQQEQLRKRATNILGKNISVVTTPILLRVLNSIEYLNTGFGADLYQMHSDGNIYCLYSDGTIEGKKEFLCTWNISNLGTDDEQNDKTVMKIIETIDSCVPYAS